MVRDAAKGAPWEARGCNVAVADLDEVAPLAAAFTGVGGAFAVLPPIFDPTPSFPEAKAMIGTLRAALVEALPPKLVVLSTVGADATRPNLLNQLGLLERALADLPNSSHVSAPRLVHGERGRGPHVGARNGRDPQLSATARPRRPHGRHRGTSGNDELGAPGWIQTEMGGSDATFTIEECIPLVADILEKNHGKAGLRYVDRFDKTLPW